MSEIRILSAQDFDALSHIATTAYPGFKIVTPEDRERFRDRMLQLHQEDPTANFHGLFRQGRLLGTMCLYDFAMHFLGTSVPTGGVGQIAVDLTHKKEHVAKEMMLFFLREYRRRGAPLVTLYPFRPDFYVKMGVGYGSKISQYRIKPAALPQGPSKASVRYLGPDDKQAIVDCYQRVATRTHGMMHKTDREMRSLFARPQNQIVGVETDGRLSGYLVYTFEQGHHFITNDLHIQEWIYETPQALADLLTFLHSQADQIRDVIIDTQDEDFHHLPADPRNGSDRLIPSVYHETNSQGVGLMIRVVDVPGIFQQLAERDFGGQSCTLNLVIQDSFLSENQGATLLQFDRGRVRLGVQASPDVELNLSIGDFSSLLFGTVQLTSLIRYGRATLSDERYVSVLSRIFAVEQKPVCLTHF